MAKVKRLTDKTGANISWAFQCPGCEMWHSCNETHPDANAPTWHFNGDVERPTFSPSVLVRFPKDGQPQRCHSFVTDGQIQFLADCTHSMAGQTVELPEME